MHRLPHLLSIALHRFHRCIKIPFPYHATQDQEIATMIQARPDQEFQHVRHEECIRPPRKIEAHGHRPPQDVPPKALPRRSPSTVLPYPINNKPFQEKFSRERRTSTPTRNNALLSIAHCTRLARSNRKRFPIHDLAGRQVHHQRSERKALGRAAADFPTGCRRKRMSGEKQNNDITFRACVCTDRLPILRCTN
jgi:hypothetical protein